MSTEFDEWKAAMDKAIDAIFGEYDEPKHRDGIPWHEAPLPPLLHKCKWQTQGGSGLTGILRCACGATRLYGLHNSRWMDKNQTRIHSMKASTQRLFRRGLL